ncbi:MAG: hypothetical protein JNG84_06185 [Archangium sp.]|nr:hypothetical protein [Archangium sp.]
MWWALAAVAVASSPDAARYVMHVDGVPVGVVRFRREGALYRYDASHVFRSTQRTHHRELTFDDAAPPEVWWLSRRRPDGCRAVTEERTEKAETVCLRAGGGTIDGQAFTARYTPDGALASLSLGAVRFEASTAEVLEGRDPFAAGFEVLAGNGAPMVEPPVPGVRARQVRGVDVASAEGESCLELARRVVKARQAKRVVVGLVIDGGRAWPHAWVELANGEQRDPTVSAADAPRWYLELPSDAGKRYLELVAGTRRVVRRP